MKIFSTVLGIVITASSVHADTLTLKYQGNTKQCAFNYTSQVGSSYFGGFGEGCPGYIPPNPPVPPTPGDCSKVLPPQGFTKNNSYANFQGVWGAFPGTYGNRNLKFGQNQYISLEFTVPTLPTNKYGRFSIISTGTSNPMSVTIAECPANFGTLQQQGCAVSSANETNVNYIINNPTSFKCSLVPGKKYYLNIIGAPLGSTQSKCTTAGCTVTIGNYPP